MSIARPSTASVVPWAGSAAGGDIATPTTGQQAAGFTSPPAAPPKQWLNWVEKFATSAGLYMMGRGVPDYAADLTYSLNDVARGSDNIVYEWINATPGSGHAPPNGTYWQVFGASWLPNALKASLADLLPSLMAEAIAAQLHIASTGNAASGSFRIANLLICWSQITFIGQAPVGYPELMTGVSWSAPFANFFGAVATPVEANLIVNLPTSLTPLTTFSAQAIPTTPPVVSYPIFHAFVIGIGTAA